MNTGRKQVVIRECTRCDRNYMVSGETALRLTQHRPATINPETGMVHTGVCPDHPRSLTGDK